MWLLFCQAFMILGIIVLLLYIAPVPFFDRSGATVMCSSSTKQLATAKAVATAIGKPTAELNTTDVQRFLFKDGTIVDSLVHPPTFPVMYEVIALKSVVLGLFSKRSPVEVANTGPGGMPRM